MTLSRTTLGFGNQFAGSTSPPQSITISNGSQQGLTNVAVTLVGANAGSFLQNSNCQPILASGSQCTIQVAFSPQAGGRSYPPPPTGYISALLNITADAVPLQSVFLSGNEVDFANPYLFIFNKLSMKVLDLSAQSPINGVLVQQSDFIGADSQQEWNIIPTPTDSAFVYIMNTSTDKPLDDKDFSLANGTFLQQWDFWGGDTQKWQLVPANDSYYYNIVNKLSGKALDDTNFSTQAGTLIQQWDNWNGDTQKWQIVAAKYVEILNRASGKALGADSYETNGTLVQQLDFQGEIRQKWLVIPTDSQFVHILNAGRGRALDDKDFSLASGTFIQEWDFWGGDTQQWQIVPVDNTYYKIVNKLSGKVLDIGNSSGTSGSNIIQSDDLGTAGQQWQIIVPAY